MIVDGNSIKEAVIESLKDQAMQQITRVCFLQYGDDLASKKFVGMKMKVAEQLGVSAVHVQSDAATTEEAIAVLQGIVAEGYDGIVIQLPLPPGIDAGAVMNELPLGMDVDVLSTAALMAFANGDTARMPPVAAAVELVLKLYTITLHDKRIVVRGKGALVGGPVMLLLDRLEVPYVAIDMYTPLPQQLELLAEADIIISGTGTPHAITPDMIKEGVVLIDAGTSEMTGKLVGDIDPQCADKASLYTPVPGGIGPITVACLFNNLFLN